MNEGELLAGDKACCLRLYLFVYPVNISKKEPFAYHYWPHFVLFLVMIILIFVVIAFNTISSSGQLYSEFQVGLDKLADTCPNSFSRVFVGFGPKGNDTAGTYEKRKDITNLKDCIFACCVDDKCNVVFMYSNNCYLVSILVYFIKGRFKPWKVCTFLYIPIGTGTKGFLFPCWSTHSRFRLSYLCSHLKTMT